jgi:hypothetical protein
MAWPCDMEQRAGVSVFLGLCSVGARMLDVLRLGAAATDAWRDNARTELCSKNSLHSPTSILLPPPAPARLVFLPKPPIKRAVLLTAWLYNGGGTYHEIYPAHSSYPLSSEQEMAPVIADLSFVEGELRKPTLWGSSEWVCRESTSPAGRGSRHGLRLSYAIHSNDSQALLPWLLVSFQLFSGRSVSHHLLSC